MNLPNTVLIIFFLEVEFVGCKIFGKYLQIAFLRYQFTHPIAESLFPILMMENSEGQHFFKYVGHSLIGWVVFEYVDFFLLVCKGSYLLSGLVLCHCVYGVLGFFTLRGH